MACRVDIDDWRIDRLVKLSAQIEMRETGIQYLSRA